MGLISPIPRFWDEKNCRHFHTCHYLISWKSNRISSYFVMCIHLSSWFCNVSFSLISTILHSSYLSLLLRIHNSKTATVIGNALLTVARSVQTQNMLHCCYVSHGDMGSELEIERTDHCCSETESVTVQICSGRNRTEPHPHIRAAYTRI